MNMHMTDQEHRQYLLTPPTTDPTQWLSDLLAAFKRGFIDYSDIHLVLQQYDTPEQYSAQVSEAWREMEKEERRQDIKRARIYKEQHRK